MCTGAAKNSERISQNFWPRIVEEDDDDDDSWQRIFLPFEAIRRLRKIDMFKFFISKWPIPGLFSFIYIFSIQLTVNIQYEICQWLDMNLGLWCRKRPLYQLSHTTAQNG